LILPLGLLQRRDVRRNTAAATAARIASVCIAFPLNERQSLLTMAKMWVTVTAMWTKMPELNKRASLQVGYESKEMYLIAITDAKTDVPDLTVETHHKLTRDRMLQKMKNASATQPLSLTIDGHPALQDEISGTEKRHKCCFSSYHRG
jgi:hypothetical protein